jgi:Short C-terminal domain
MGLIGGMARTAVIAGTATAVSNRVSRRQAERWAQEDSPCTPRRSTPSRSTSKPAPTPAPAPAPDPLEQLTKLGQLRDSGVLTEAEFEAQKAKILAG